jgi:hypothetical protein
VPSSSRALSSCGSLLLRGRFLLCSRLLLRFDFVDVVFFAAAGRGRPAAGWVGAGPVALALRAGAPAGAGAAPGGAPADGAPSQNLISASSSP